MSNTENFKLIQKAKRRDPEAFTELMNLYMKDMYRTAVAILMNDADAADAIQETILTCWERLSSLRDNKLFKTWMTRILINKCHDIKNKRIEAVQAVLVRKGESAPAANYLGMKQGCKKTVIAATANAICAHSGSPASTTLPAKTVSATVS